MAGKATLSLLFQDGDYKESSQIDLLCDKAGFKALTELIVVESRKHVVARADPDFVCLECGHKFYSAHAAETAAFGDGCPGCGGSDIEVA